MQRKLPFDELMQLLNGEIQWCIEHPDKAFHAEYRNGFTNGLIQAKHLIDSLARGEYVERIAKDGHNE